MARRTSAPSETRSHPSRGAWIEISRDPGLTIAPGPSRTPRGVRGLKLPQTKPFVKPPRSHPSRGAWIEMLYAAAEGGCQWSHPSRGAWIEIVYMANCTTALCGRTPRGVRGLKLHLSHQRLEARDASHPSRGAWIEIIRDVRSGFLTPSRTPRGVRGLK